MWAKNQSCASSTGMDAELCAGNGRELQVQSCGQALGASYGWGWGGAGAELRVQSYYGQALGVS